MADNFQKFIKSLEESKKDVWRIANYLCEKGYPVTVNPTFVCPDPSKWKDYVDDGDLTISLRVEVKRSSKSFTCVEDYPFADFMICAKHSWDNSRPKPFFYIIMNKDKTHIGVVKGTSNKDWHIAEKGDSKYGDGYSQEKYMIPKEQVHFMALPEEQND